jgi:hypothetical protein
VTIVAVPQSIVAQITNPQSPQDAKRQRVTHRSNTFSCCEDSWRNPLATCLAKLTHRFTKVR